MEGDVRERRSRPSARVVCTDIRGMSLPRACIAVLLVSTGVLLGITSAISATGTNPAILFHLPEMIIVFGVTFIGLAMSHGSRMVQFWRDARSGVRTPATEELAQRLATAGRLYAVIGGVASLLPGALALLGQFATDPELMGLVGAGMITGPAWALFLSEIVFHGLAMAYTRQADFSTIEKALTESRTPARQSETPH